MATATTSGKRVPRTGKRRGAKRPSAAALRTFLERLAQAANVTAAAKAAKLSTPLVYALRGRDAGFRAKWHAALCEGYARLETELLAEALAAPDPELTDAQVKARQYKQRLALALLAAHRASVRGERSAAAGPVADETKGAKLRLGNIIETMAVRMAHTDPHDDSISDAARAEVAG
jgi:hypothetical protein